ncbi:MAG: T9SS type A sorting domain-containing protein [candidate division Zixibacteria bacterium]|nr:T9SS type A sorting domain-containing protein [candidate division Zixibacteria bacterium]
MTKRFHLIAIIIVILTVPSLVFAGAHSFGAAKVIDKGDNQIIVPLEITNKANLTALDIPLSFSEGVTLEEVNFENTRVDYFDLKIANINNEENTVIIGLLPQMSPVHKPDLEAGSGAIANLVFKVTDPDIAEITIEAITTVNPNHELTFVYHEFDADGIPSSNAITNSSSDIGEVVEFESVTIQVASKEIPDDYALMQNYPNPFNPATDIAFALPEAAHVKLSIYNVLGQEVTILQDDMMEAGQHVINWDARDRASGIYFYRISADNFSETKKMMLLK